MMMRSISVSVRTVSKNVMAPGVPLLWLIGTDLLTVSDDMTTKVGGGMPKI